MAPVILELSRHSRVLTVCSGQHTDLAEEPLSWFGIKPDARFELDPKARTLSGLTSQLLVKMEEALNTFKPDVVMAQGDTTTLLAAAMSAFYLSVPFAHVEAGLRTGDLAAPFPEEFNRTVAGRIAKWHFCPTIRAANNLQAEGISQSRIFVTGNTGIDALRISLARIPANSRAHTTRRILLTAHRRENQGSRLDSIAKSVIQLTHDFGDVEFTIPVHPNPDVKTAMFNALSGLPRVQLLPPLTYPELISEMNKAYLILTDSGGIQEEAPFLKKPVLVLRDVTERPEAVELGVARMVGTNSDNIISATAELLRNPDTYRKMASGASPYGDGYAAERIRAVLLGAEIAGHGQPRAGS